MLNLIVRRNKNLFNIKIYNNNIKIGSSISGSIDKNNSIIHNINIIKSYQGLGYGKYLLSSTENVLFLNNQNLKNINLIAHQRDDIASAAKEAPSSSPYEEQQLLLLRDTFEEEVRLLAEAGHSEQAVALLLGQTTTSLTDGDNNNNSSSKIVPSREVCECVVVSCAGRRLSGRVRQVFVAMGRWGVGPSQRMYTIAINSCGAKVWRALRYLDEMIAKEVQPNAVTYACAIGVCKRARRWREAKKLLHEMRECSIAPNEVALVRGCDHAFCSCCILNWALQQSQVR